MITSLTLVVLAGLLGPMLAVGRRSLVPVLVGELIEVWSSAGQAST